MLPFLDLYWIFHHVVVDIFALESERRICLAQGLSIMIVAMIKRVFMDYFFTIFSSERGCNGAYCGICLSFRASILIEII